MSLENISAQLSGHNKSQTKLPPVELWDPPFCGDIDIEIKADGSWYYQGSAFKRQRLVKLFSSVLKKEQQQYFLVTPVEKVGIKVADAPFVITQWRWLTDEQKIMQLTTNLGDEFTLDNDHPMHIAGNDCLYIKVRRNLTAKVHRNIYYQWIELAIEETNKNGTELVFYSAEQRFLLGQF